jgi:hypothetical protein
VPDAEPDDLMSGRGQVRHQTAASVPLMTGDQDTHATTPDDGEARPRAADVPAGALPGSALRGQMDSTQRCQLVGGGVTGFLHSTSEDLEERDNLPELTGFLHGCSELQPGHSPSRRSQRCSAGSKRGVMTAAIAALRHGTDRDVRGPGIVAVM